MRTSLKGHKLPESYADFRLLLEHGLAQFENCRTCHKQFDRANTVSALGWAETQISGECEACFDALFNDEEPSTGE